MERRTDFCIHCRRITPYSLTKIPVTQEIRDREYEFYITTAICNECGNEMNPPGLIDQNAKEIDRQYRKAENIIEISEIEKLLGMYNIGKAPLSLALGFGEVTITRYLAGQVPSKEYSDIMRHALVSAEYMEKLLEQNRAKVGETAYRKAIIAAKELNKLYEPISLKLKAVLFRVFTYVQEITPLMLQKMLYYIQGIYLAINDLELFPEECEAWVHGPVYRNVYMLFRDFKFNPIDDDRFSLLEGFSSELSDLERSVIDNVISTFGIYSGKTLESITHKEKPWLDVREGYVDNERACEVISKASMASYFKSIDAKYGITATTGLQNYINDMLSNPSFPCL